MVHRTGRGPFVVVLAVVLMACALSVPQTVASAAATLPTPPSATPLPTVQIDGVAWNQVVQGNTVYVGGRFSTARPAGAAPGKSTVSRKNLLAFDITTGVLKSGFVANTNGQVLGLAMAPDGSRLYVSGEFTTVNGVTANRIAALNPTTGAVDKTFKASVNSRVRSMVVTSSTVFAGGLFNTAGGKARTNLAAFRRSDGAVLAWAPKATGGQVMALAYVPGGDRIAVAGAFTALNGTTALGSGAVSPSSGATMSFPVNQVVKDSGSNSAVYSLHSDGTKIYGSGYSFGGGNFEGNFAVDPKGSIVWLNDMYGDEYDVFQSRGMVYSVGHMHNDANLEGGIPEVVPRKANNALVQTANATGFLQPSNYGVNFGGQPAPTLLHWWPSLALGSVSGANQAAWTVGGNEKYIVLAGEFPMVGGVAQQGIVRFTYRDIQQSKEAPVYSGADFVPDVTSPAAGVAQVSVVANWDRDDASLNYSFEREGAGTVATAKVKSHNNIRPIITRLEQGLAPGTYRYRVVATDSIGLKATGNWVSVTVKASGSLDPYASAVLADSPTTYRRLGEPSGAVVDSAYTYDGWVSDGVTRGVPGAIAGNTAYTFNGAQAASPSESMTTPRALSTEAWFKTTTTQGGAIVSWGDDWQVNYVTYMGDDGKVRFGVEDYYRNLLTSTRSYNDGAWHHVVSTLDWATGQKLYVDGVLVASNPNVKHGRDSLGYWRIGGASLWAWGSASSDYITATIDEVASYWRAIPADRVLAHYQLGSGA